MADRQISAADIQSPALSELFTTWSKARGRRAFPKRSDIDPAKLSRSLLPHMFVADIVGDPPDFRFRLAGTQVVQNVGLELTGRFLSELPLSGLDPIVEEYRAAVYVCEPRYSTLSYISADGYRRRVERLILPLSRSGNGLDTLIGAFHYRRHKCDPGDLL